MFKSKSKKPKILKTPQIDMPCGMLPTANRGIRRLQRTQTPTRVQTNSQTPQQNYQAPAVQILGSHQQTINYVNQQYQHNMKLDNFGQHQQSVQQDQLNYHQNSQNVQNQQNAQNFQNQQNTQNHQNLSVYPPQNSSAPDYILRDGTIYINKSLLSLNEPIYQATSELSNNSSQHSSLSNFSTSSQKTGMLKERCARIDTKKVLQATKGKKNLWSKSASQLESSRSRPNSRPNSSGSRIPGHAGSDVYARSQARRSDAYFGMKTSSDDGFC